MTLPAVPPVDAIIIGAGPAGLSAALILGRSRRNVIVFDSGEPRNRASQGLHGFLTRDGISPMELRRLGREQLAPYATVAIRDEAVSDARRVKDGFEVVTAGGAVHRCRLLLLATGRFDELPSQPGFRELFGRGVYHCAFCDGWEHRDQPLVAYGKPRDAADRALALLDWSKNVTAVTDGDARFPQEDLDRLQDAGIRIVIAPVERLEADARGSLAGIRHADGSVTPCTALFLVSESPQKSVLPEKLGCDLDEEGSVKCEGHAATKIPGLYIAGNVRGGIHLAIMAAAEGAEAGLAMNLALRELKNGTASPEESI